MSRPVILLDVDGVLADFIGGVCSVLRTHGYKRTPEDFKTFDIKDTLNEDEYEIAMSKCFSTGFCSRLDWYPGAKELVKELQELGRVFAVTTPGSNSSWCGERIKWLSPVIGRKEVIFTHRKELIRGHLLIEDCFRNVAYGDPDVSKILVDRPWNRGASLQKIVDREYEYFTRVPLEGVLDEVKMWIDDVTIWGCGK